MDVPRTSPLGDDLHLVGMFESEVFELFSSEGLGEGLEVWGFGDSDE